MYFSLLLLAMTSGVFAQEYNKHDKGDDKDVKYMPMVTHVIGGSFQKFDGLNGRVANLPQYKQLRDYTATLGLGVVEGAQSIYFRRRYYGG